MSGGRLDWEKRNRAESVRKPHARAGNPIRQRIQSVVLPPTPKQRLYLRALCEEFAIEYREPNNRASATRLIGDLVARRTQAAA